MIDLLIKKYRLVYFSSLVVGFFVILLSHALNQDLVSLFIISGWMIFLGFLISKKSYVNYEESDADYFYYLGFIYTITSLAITFLFITFSDNSGLKDSKQIIRSFGLGLITTFIGLAGRVLLYQLFERQTVGAEDAVQRISVIGDRFARQLGSLTGSMKSNLEEITGSYNASAATLNQATVNLAGEISALAAEMQALRKSTTKSIGVLEKAAESFSKTLDSRLSGLSLTIDGFNSSIINATQSTNFFNQNIFSSSLFEDFARSLKSAQSAVVDFHGVVQNFDKSISQISLNLSSSQEEALILQSKLAKNLNTLSNASDKQVKLIEDFLNSFESNSQKYIEYSNSLVEFSNVAVTAGDSLKVLNSRSEAVANSISSFNLLPSINADLLSSQKAFIDNLNGMASSSSELSSELSNSLKIIIEQLKSATSEYENSSDVQAKFISDLQESQASVTETHAALLNTIKSLKKEFE